MRNLFMIVVLMLGISTTLLAGDNTPVKKEVKSKVEFTSSDVLLTGGTSIELENSPSPADLKAFVEYPGCKNDAILVATIEHGIGWIQNECTMLAGYSYNECWQYTGSTWRAVSCPVN